MLIQENKLNSFINLHHESENVTEAADLLKAMASESRLKIMCILSEGEKSVTDLADQTNQTSSSVSQHLSRLRAAGLVESRRDAQTIYYRNKVGVGQDLMGVLCTYFKP